jgi:hypothetical protein
MPRLATCIALAVVVAVALSPLCEIFDKTDEWSQDGSDLALYIICLFSFLAWSVRRGKLLIKRVASLRIGVFGIVGQPWLQRKPARAVPEERQLFLTLCDLRI